jgi:hypothetical protein
MAHDDHAARNGRDAAVAANVEGAAAGAPAHDAAVARDAADADEVAAEHPTDPV